MHADEERRANLRAGLVAATLVNVNRKKGSRLVRAGDFFTEPIKAEDYMVPEIARAAMDRWAAEQNAAFDRS